MTRRQKITFWQLVALSQLLLQNTAAPINQSTLSYHQIWRTLLFLCQVLREYGLLSRVHINKANGSLELPLTLMAIQLVQAQQQDE